MTNKDMNTSEALAEVRKKSIINVTRCPAPLGTSTCGSAIFYDWGIQLLTTNLVGRVDGQRGRENIWNDSVKICARCTTPYLVEEGQLIDLSSELSSEDVKMILSRGQATLPHVKIKDPLTEVEAYNLLR